MRYFFIDLENVRNEGLEGVLSLNEKDMVYIFYSENAFSMAIPTMESITNSRCSSKFIKTNYIGKNAMDFQIVSLFGAMIERCKEGSFYIISKDNGFRSAVSFCESFFSEYPIKCGVYPRIITAIAAESKEAGKESASETVKEKKSRSRRSRKRSGKHEQSAVQNFAADDRAVLSDPVADMIIATDEVAEGIEKTGKSGDIFNDSQNEIKTDGQDTSENGNENTSGKRKRTRKRKGRGEAAAPDKEDNPDNSKDMPDENDENSATNSGKTGNNGSGARESASGSSQRKSSAGNDDKAEQENATHGRLEYIYRLLGEYLSEKTIEIYAGYIDEGIAKSNNRDELQGYFRENLGDDEGEALFKVVRSDYEQYKQTRPKKTSHTRRKRSGKNGMKKEKEAE